MSKKINEANLSKSKFLAGLQCPKRLYLLCYQPELVGETDEKLQAILDQGKEVGILAQKVFPCGTLTGDAHLKHKEAVTRTKKLIADKSVPAIFEAAFSFKDILIRVDILERLPGNRWRLIEVKSSTETKEYHLPDVAIQKYVLEQCGYKVPEARLMHLNREYVYDGKKYQLNELFTIDNLTEEIKSIEDELPLQLAEQWKTLALKKAPRIESGSQCTDPFECEFYSLCHEELPDDWVGNLPRIGKKVDQLIKMGIESIHDIPDSFSLTDTQRRACECVKKNKPYYDRDLKDEITALKYPIYFMDFETLFPALPRYAGMHPYDQIPFQWSVHVQKKTEAEPEHHEFLQDEGNDPRDAFITSLLSVLEKHKKAPIIAYSPFESTRLGELSKSFPKYAKRIDKVKDRLWDLLQVIRAHVYHPKFLGSFSIKNVLPALGPDMSYDDMEVADGAEAGLAYEKLISGELDPKEKQFLKKALLEYCKQDTIAMVSLLEHLKKK
jgi:predicted RecB family nuclease